ncbi:Uncharacterised protein [Mycobacteroides abscessus subsp. abscessus]|nr:Uncharacterised protein [Mycobacteroides abscessus subsp. abscessus]
MELSGWVTTRESQKPAARPAGRHNSSAMNNNQVSSSQMLLRPCSLRISSKRTEFRFSTSSIRSNSADATCGRLSSNQPSCRWKYSSRLPITRPKVITMVAAM